MSNLFGEENDPFADQSIDLNQLPDEISSPNYTITGTRTEFEEEPVVNTGEFTQTRLRFARLRNVGTRHTAVEQRNKRIVEIASPLPPGNRLSGRGVYWFVTTEKVEIIIEDLSQFMWKEPTVETTLGVTYYLNNIDFRRNKKGFIRFKFTDGHEETIECYSTDKSNEKRKTSSNENMAGDDKSHSSIYAAPQNNNNNSDYKQNVMQPPNNNNQTLHILPEEAANVGRFNPSHVITNFILLVPDDVSCIDIAEKALSALGMTKQVSSGNQQHLYCETDTTIIRRHVLIFPYGDKGRTRKLQDYIPYANEVILVIENQAEQDKDLHYIKQVNGFPRVQDNNLITDTLQFFVKTPDFDSIELDYRSLNTSVKQLLRIYELQRILGGVTCKMTLAEENKQESLENCILQWILNSTPAQAPLDIFMCFKYETDSVPFTKYAQLSLHYVHTVYDCLTVNGSVLVYIRCPSYTPWYILQRKNDIFSSPDLIDAGLTEIYECFISDIEASMQRPDNEEFMDELIYFKEQMIMNNVPYEPTKNRFRMTAADMKEDSTDDTTNSIDYQPLQSPLFNSDNLASSIGKLIVQQVTLSISNDVIIVDPKANVVSIEIVLKDTQTCLFSDPVLWNIKRNNEGQGSFYTEQVCTFTRTEKGAKIDLTKPDHEYKLFVTFNYMSDVYNGVLYTPIPICNDELKNSEVNIKHKIEETAEWFGKAAMLRPISGRKIESFGIRSKIDLEPPRKQLQTGSQNDRPFFNDVDHTVDVDLSDDPIAEVPEDEPFSIFQPLEEEISQNLSHYSLTDVIEFSDE